MRNKLSVITIQLDTARVVGSHCLAQIVVAAEMSVIHAEIRACLGAMRVGLMNSLLTPTDLHHDKLVLYSM